MQSDNEGLKREIGLWGLISNSINITIGAGIFIIPAIVAGRLGNASLWPYLVCGSMIILIMLCFAETGSQITRSGGAYSYIETAFGKYAGFLTANIFIFGGAVMANAAVANGLADTLASFLPVFNYFPVRLLFFALLFSSLAWLNVRGVSGSILLVKTTTIIKLTPLIIIAIAGLFYIKASGFGEMGSHTISDIGEMSLILLFAFVGAETALNVSGEIKRPEKTIPAGIMLSMAAVVLIYILIQVVVQGLLGSSLSEYSDAPLVETARRIAGQAGAAVILAGASFSMFGNLSGMVLSMPRILFAAAKDKVLPFKRLSEVDKKHNTPAAAVITYAALGFIFASVGEFRQLAMLSSASYLLIYLGVVASLIAFRLRKTPVNNTFRLRGGYLIPVVSGVSIIWVLTNLPAAELLAMSIFIAVVTILYLLLKLFIRNN